MPRLSSFLLGPFQTTLDGKPVRFESDTVRALLCYLVLDSDHPHRRESLASLFWSEQSQDVALKNLRHALYRLRQSLGDGEPKEGSETSTGSLLVTTQTVQFNALSGAWVDVAEFRSLLAQCAEHKHRRLDACSSCYTRLVSAAQLYRGDLMLGFALPDNTVFEEWLLLEREKLHIEVLDVLGVLSRLSAHRGDYANALLYARRQVELEPWREEAHMQAMQLLLLMGQRSAAIAQYAACRRALAEEFGVEPSPQTQALYEQARSSASPSTGGITLVEHSFPHNLPAELTPFVGRKRELEEIGKLLESPRYRLVTLVGSGGTGKTRLAQQAARGQLGCFRDGVFFVGLAHLTDGGQIASAIAEVVGLKPAAKEEPQSQLRAFLAMKEMLLVLDNFEHLKDGAGLLSLLLRDAPDLSLLVTSRELLGLSAETTFNVDGLQYPRIEGPRSSEPAASIAASISSYEAVQLFLERSQGVNRNFVLSEKTAEGVARLCEKVAGIPLGLELAAAWVHLYTPAQIAASIARNYDFLTSRFGDVPEQHRSLRAVFNYSWNLLTEVEQVMFARLSVFRDGWDVEAAEKVAGVSMETLGSLAAKSLISVDTGAAEPEGGDASAADRVDQGSRGARFGMHEMLRQYAAEQQGKNSAEQTSLQREHAGYYTQMAGELAPRIWKASGISARTQHRREMGNFNAALDRVIGSREQEAALRLVAAMQDLWRQENAINEARKWTSAALELEGDADPALRAQVLNNAAALARVQGDHDRATLFLEESLRIRRAIGEPFSIAEALNTLGGIQLGRKNYEQAKALYEESLSYLQGEDTLEQQCWVRCNLALCLVGLKQGDPALVLIRESLSGFERLEEQFGAGYALGSLSDAYYSLGDMEQAITYRSLSLSRFREIANRTYLGISLINLSLLLQESGRESESVVYVKEALPILWEAGGPHMRFQCLESAIRLAANFVGPGRVVRLLGAFETLAKAYNGKVYQEIMDSLVPVISRLRAALTPQEWEGLWLVGSVWTLEQAWAEAGSLVDLAEESIRATA